METDREMTERLVNEAEYVIKKNLKYILGFLILVILIIWVIKEIF
jgi:hypothetical protein